MPRRLAAAVASAALDGGHDQDLRRGDVELPDGARLSRAIEPKGEPAGREMLGEKSLGWRNRLGAIPVPLGECQVAVSRLEQSKLRHDLVTPSGSVRDPNQAQTSATTRGRT